MRRPPLRPHPACTQPLRLLDSEIIHNEDLSHMWNLVWHIVAFRDFDVDEQEWSLTFEQTTTFQLPVQEESVGHAQTYKIIEMT
jgi:hypothetical protein